jgi:hypothetical protein
MLWWKHTCSSWRWRIRVWRLVRHCASYYATVVSALKERKERTTEKQTRGRFGSLIAGPCSTCKIGDCKPTVYERTSTWGPSPWYCMHSVRSKSYGEENGIKKEIGSYWPETLNYTFILPKHMHLKHFNITCFFFRRLIWWCWMLITLINNAIASWRTWNEQRYWSKI